MPGAALPRDWRRYAARLGRAVPWLLLGLLPLVLTWPLVTRLATQVPRSAAWFDAYSYTRIVEERGRAIAEDPLDPYAVSWFHPHPDAVVLNEPYLTHGLLSAVLRPFTGSGEVPAVLRYNLILLIWLLIGACGMYAWLREVWRDRIGSLLMAVPFAYGAYASYQLGRVGHLAYGLVPLCMLALWRLLDRPSYVGAVLAAALWWACFHASLYTGLFLAAAAAVGVLPLWIYFNRQQWRAWLAPVLLALVLLAAALLASTWPWIHASDPLRELHGAAEMHRAGQLTDLLPHGPDWLGLPSLWPEDRKWYPGTHFAGFGVVLPLLVALFLLRRRGKGGNLAALGAAGAGLIGLLLFLGPEPIEGVPGPLAALRAWVPGCSGIRDSTRAFPVVLFALCTLAAWPLSRWPAHRGKLALVGLALGLIIWEAMPAPVRTHRFAPPSRSLTRLVDSWEPGAVAVLGTKGGKVRVDPPMKARCNFIDLFHRRPAVMNKSSLYPPLTRELWRLAKGRVSPDIVPLWWAAGVRFVWAEPHDKHRPDAALEPLAGSLEALARDRRGVLWRLVPGKHSGARFADRPPGPDVPARVAEHPRQHKSGTLRAGDQLLLELPCMRRIRGVAWQGGRRPLFRPHAFSVEIEREGDWREVARADELVLDRRLLTEPARAVTWLDFDAVEARRLRVRALAGLDRTPWKVSEAWIRVEP